MSPADLARRLFMQGFTVGTSQRIAQKADVDRNGDISPAEQATVDHALETVREKWEASPRVKVSRWIAKHVETTDDFTLGQSPNAIGQALGWLAPNPDKMLDQALDAALKTKK